MLDNIFEILFLAFFVAGCVIRAVCLFRVPHWWRDKKNIVDDREAALDKLLMFFQFLGMQVLPLIYVFSPWLNFSDYLLPTWAGLVAGWVGAAIFVAALWLLWRSHADLGHNFSPELKIKEEHSLVTRGIFSYIRHPMYAAHFLWAIAQALLLQNWIAGLAFLVSFIPLYMLRVPREEQMMLEQFGDEYREYIARTGRIIPFLRG